MNPGAQGGIETPQLLLTELLANCQGDPNGRPIGIVVSAHVLRYIRAVLQDRPAQQAPGNLHGPHLLNLQQPPRGEPGPGADRVEPEVHHARRGNWSGGAKGLAHGQAGTLQLDSGHGLALSRFLRPVKFVVLALLALILLALVLLVLALFRRPSHPASLEETPGHSLHHVARSTSCIRTT